MKITSVEFSTLFLQSIADLGQDSRERLLSSLELEVLETTEDPAAIFARDPRCVGRLVLDDERGTAALFTLKSYSN